MPHRSLVVTAAFALAAVSACGGDDNDVSSSAPTTMTEPAGGKSIAITMVDIAFEPGSITVAQGDTITFSFSNEGKVPHDAFIGDAEAQADHEEEMAESGGHGHGTSDEVITVQPGTTATLTHTFDEAGTVEIGCHQPGHYAAGMKVTVVVT